MGAEWSLSVIQSLVQDRIQEHNINLVTHLSFYSYKQIITFDSYGISYHPNHIAVSLACQSLSPQMDIFTLHTVPLWRKYLSIFDSVPTILPLKKHYPNRILYINSPSNTLRVQRAMREGHKSQMVWFRWGWIMFSRYLIINELDLIPRA